MMQVDICVFHNDTNITISNYDGSKACRIQIWPLAFDHLV
jgi:hypothetical protein